MIGSRQVKLITYWSEKRVKTVNVDWKNAKKGGFRVRKWDFWNSVVEKNMLFKCKIGGSLYYAGRKTRIFWFWGSPPPPPFSPLFPYYSRLCQSLPHTCRAWGLTRVPTRKMTLFSSWPTVYYNCGKILGQL